MSTKTLGEVGFLPDRATPAERVAHLDADVRDLTARLGARIRERASEYSVTGWTLDEESYEFEFHNDETRTVILRAVITRE